jgi:hypothetical protein
MTPTPSTPPTTDEVVEHLIAALDHLGVPRTSGPRLLRLAAFELQMRLPPPPGETTISPEVPHELAYDVLLGFLEEDQAVERGKRAARAVTEEERAAILSGVARAAPAPQEPEPAPVPSLREIEPAPNPERPAPLVRPMPPPGYRPVGSPPWGEP